MAVMVRCYKKKTGRAEKDEGAILRGVKDIIRGEKRSIAARNCGIPRQTLNSRIDTLLKKYTMLELKRKFEDSGNESDDDEMGVKPKKAREFSSKYSVGQIFNSEHEKKIEEYLIGCDRLNSGLTYKQIRELAYDYGVALKISLPVSWQSNKIAGIDWMIAFMKRHPKLSLRKPEQCSVARAAAFNKTAVKGFFDNYLFLMEKYKFTAKDIYNLDETGIQTVLKTVKVVSASGKKQVATASSAEKGQTVTVVGIISAAGSAMPPVFLYPRVRDLNDYIVDGVPGSVSLGSPKGWITKETFINVLWHFKEQSRCSKDHPILLIVDNHETHISLASITYCRDNGIHMLTLPPHTSHRLQPLDVSVYFPFKTYCAQAFQRWMSNNPGKTIRMKDIAKLTKDSFYKGFSSSNIMSGFKKTGLWPINVEAFTDDDFAPSTIWHQPPREPSGSETPCCSKTLSEQEEPQVEGASTAKEVPPREPSGSETPCCSKTLTEQEEPQVEEASTPKERPSRVPILTPEDVRPRPQVQLSQQNGPKRRKVGKSTIYTLTPEKSLLELKEKQAEEKAKKALERANKAEERKKEREQKKKEKEQKKKEKDEGRRNMKSTRDAAKVRCKKQLFTNSDSSDSDVEMGILPSSSGGEWNEEDPEQEKADLPAIENRVEEYVAVNYDGTVFPGQVVAITENGITVKAMKRCGRLWKWPEKDDILNYDYVDVVGHLKTPTKFSKSREIYFIPEID